MIFVQDGSTESVEIWDTISRNDITPLHPRANGEDEAFMKVLNKTEQIANLQNKDSAIAI